MKEWTIVSVAGVDMGVYEGDTKEDALDAMCRDAGYKDAKHAAAVGGPWEGSITEVEEGDAMGYVIERLDGTTDGLGDAVVFDTEDEAWTAVETAFGRDPASDVNGVRGWLRVVKV